MLCALFQTVNHICGNTTDILDVSFHFIANICGIVDHVCYLEAKLPKIPTYSFILMHH